MMGKTVVTVTHDAAFAAADRRIGIVDGRIDAEWRGRAVRSGISGSARSAR